MHSEKLIYNYRWHTCLRINYYWYKRQDALFSTVNNIKWEWPSHNQLPRNIFCDRTQVLPACSSVNSEYSICFEYPRSNTTICTASVLNITTIFLGHYEYVIYLAESHLISSVWSIIAYIFCRYDESGIPIEGCTFWISNYCRIILLVAWISPSSSTLFFAKSQERQPKIFLSYLSRQIFLSF